MIYIGIDVAKDKHDCFITNSEGEVLFNAFTIPNNADGFHDLFHPYVKPTTKNKLSSKAETSSYRFR